MTRAILSAACAMLAVAGCSNRPAAPDLRIEGAWARATAPGQASGAAYLTIDNQGDGDDRLATVTTPRAATATIHDSASDGGVMRMRMLGDLPIPAGKRVVLAPGGTHIMIAPLASPLKAGETFDLTLHFDHAGDRRVPVTVVALGAR